MSAPLLPGTSDAAEGPTVRRGLHWRPAVSPVRLVLPATIGRQISRFDRAVDAAVARRWRGRPLPDRLFYSASALGDFSLLWHLIGTTRALGSPRHQHQAVRLAVSLGVESVLINSGVKSLFRRTRPPFEQRHHRHQLRRPRSSSFPSGHATSGFMAATLLADRSGRWRPVWYGLAVIVAASRVHVGIHHASDVIVGALVGTALGRVVLRVWPLPPPAISDAGPPEERALDVGIRRIGQTPVTPVGTKGNEPALS
ncbi:MAG TPA: phosphatase PAP2 family protein [Acidimicrobiales bacterium]|nr:phosphatase PAP2 family protein [Acidimicrobiales bacterium]